MTLRCPGCDTEAPIGAGGLCRRCRDELRFVVRPAAHREMERRRAAAEAGLRDDLERLGVVIISAFPEHNGLWICDFCNDPIPVDGQQTLIPLLGSYALCMPCVTDLPYWPDAWTEPRPRPCRCGACQRPVLAALAPVS